ncbi:MAG: ferredoxin [Sphingomonadales bacterium]|nr:MAG: ferredoxin [Sphingomonadales bacterium]
MGERVRVAALADVAVGVSVPVEVEGRSLLVCRSASGVYAIENLCSHQLAKLEGGKLKGPHIFCPLHGVRFDMRTGAPNGTLTKKPINVYETTVEDDEVYAQLPG